VCGFFLLQVTIRELNDSRQIGFATYIAFSMSLPYVMINVYLEDSVAMFVASNMCAMFGSVLTMCVIFLPKARVPHTAI
jgi:hypothetical protein